MIRLTWRQIAARPGRSLALALGIIVASTGFTVLTASARASQLETRGSVAAHATTIYDILVRPENTKSRLERTEGLVQPGFLTGIYGGISLAQWHEIQKIQGVAVAAPIEMLGYAFPDLTIAVPVADSWAKSGDSLVRVDVDWSWDNGLTHVAQTPDFALVTSQRLRSNAKAPAYSNVGTWLVSTRDGKAKAICPVSRDATRPDNRPETRRPSLLCFSRTGGGASVDRDYQLHGQTAVPVKFPLSYVVAAVDPASEDALDDLSGALSSGKGLAGAPTDYPQSATGKGVPVLMADQTPEEIKGTITVSRLSKQSAQLVMDGAVPSKLLPFHGTIRDTTEVTAQSANDLLVQQFRTAKPKAPPHSLTRFMPGELTMLGQVSLPHIDLSSTPPRVELTAPKEPKARDFEQGVQFQVPGSGDLAARTIETSRKYGEFLVPSSDTLYLRGTFDPSKLKGLGEITAQTLAGFDAAPADGGDKRSVELLGGRPLQPSGYLGGLVQPPPTMLTTLSAARILTDDYTRGHKADPISSIRVRVAGVHGVDEKSRQRVKLVAQRIQQKTGLDVDITTGSSGTLKSVVLPAGQHGRPVLTLHQWWVKKGVAIAILKQVDKKSAALFVLVLLVSALAVANSAVASVRSRRRQLGIMACLGWRRGDLFRVVILELLMVAGAAGIMSAVLAWTLSRLVDTPVTFTRASLAIPAALVVAVIAGFVPAWMAARSAPIDAVQYSASAPRRARRITRLTSLAYASLLRVKTRTLLAATGLGVAVVAFTVLLAITLAFQGAVVGTILGDAVAIQARAADYAATTATLLLAFLGVANVMYLNIRDRGPELATLQSVGWTESHLTRLLIIEGGAIGVLGATPGAVIGLALAGTLTDTFNAMLVIGALIAWSGAVVLAALAAAFATTAVKRLPIALLLTEKQ